MRLIALLVFILTGCSLKSEYYLYQVIDDKTLEVTQEYSKAGSPLFATYRPDTITIFNSNRDIQAKWFCPNGYYTLKRGELYHHDQEKSKTYLFLLK